MCILVPGEGRRGWGGGAVPGAGVAGIWNPKALCLPCGISSVQNYLLLPSERRKGAQAVRLSLDKKGIGGFEAAASRLEWSAFSCRSRGNALSSVGRSERGHKKA